MMTIKKTPKIDAFLEPVNYGKEEEDLLQDIFTENFLDHFLLKIDVSEISEQKREKIANELCDVIEKNLQRPDKTIDPKALIFFYSKGLLAAMVQLKMVVDFKKFKSEYEKK